MQIRIIFNRPAQVSKCNYPAMCLKRLPLAIASFSILAIPVPVIAAVSADLNPNTNLGTTVQSNNGDYTVGGGAFAGSNNFHSFYEFSVSSGERAIFQPNGASNIIARVTGPSASTINGEIRAIESGINKSFWLLNPNGVVVGSGAQFTLTGTVALGAADNIAFQGVEPRFSLNSNEQEVQGLSADPAAFGFLENSTAGDFSSDGWTLIEQDSLTNSNVTNNNLQNIIIAGNNGVTLSNTTLETFGFGSEGYQNPYYGGDGGDIRITANTGNIELKSGTVLKLGSTGDSYEDIGNIFIKTNGDFYLYGAQGTNQIRVDSRNSASSKIIEIDAENIYLLNSQFYISTLNSGDGPALNFRASSIVDFTGSKITSILNSYNGGLSYVGSTGDISIEASHIQLRDSEIESVFSNGTDTLQGFAGGISLVAGNLIELASTNLIAKSNTSSLNASGGDITLSSENIYLSNGASIESTNFGSAPSGAIILTATEKLSSNYWENSPQVLEAVSIISGGQETFGIPQNVEIYGGDVFLNNTYINASTSNNSGHSPAKLLIQSPGHDVSIINSEFVTSTFAGSAAGDIEINGKSIFLFEGARIFAESEAMGVGGSIRLNAESLLSVSDSQTIVSTSSNSTGDAGGITLSAPSLHISSGALLAAETNGVGNAGSILIQSQQDVAIEQSRVLSRSNNNSTGSAGSIEIKSKGISIQESTISTNAGTETEESHANIDILAEEGSVTLNNSTLSANTSGRAEAGEVTITANTLMQNDGAVSSTTAGAGNAGTINISASKIDFRNNAEVSASTSNVGRAGDISISLLGAEATSSIVSSTITSTSQLDVNNAIDNDQLGEAGNIRISGGLLEISSSEISTTTESNRSENSASGTISLNEIDSLSLTDSLITTSSQSEAPSGDINLSGGNISLLRAELRAEAHSTGEAGSVTVDAIRDLNANTSDISSKSINEASGSAGSIQLSAANVFLEATDITTEVGVNVEYSDSNISIASSDGLVSLMNSTIIGRTSGSANAGRIVIGSNEYQQTGGEINNISSGTGNAGSIIFQGAGEGGLSRFNLTDGKIRASSLGSGETGTIKILADGDIYVTGSNANKAEISVAAENAASGAAQMIQLQGSNIALNDARISATTAANTAHNTVADIRLESTGNVNLNDSDITTETSGATAAGTITIGNADNRIANLNLGGDSNITSSTSGSGKAGAIGIFASNNVSLIGGSSADIVTQQARKVVANNGGNIEAPTIASNGSGVGNGGAGSVSITAVNLNLVNASITTSAGGTNGGDINLNISDNLTLNSSLIAANTTGSGNTANLTAGSVLINPSRSAAASIGLFNGSGITANAAGFANGGEVRLNSRNLFKSWDSAISADSELGVTGIVDQSAPAFDESGLVEELIIPLLDASDLLSRTCDTAGQRSSFVQRHALRNRQPTDFMPVKVPLRPMQLTEDTTKPLSVSVDTIEHAPSADTALCNRVLLQSSL